MGVQRPTTHYPIAFERQAMRCQGYLRRCTNCGLLMPLLGGRNRKHGFRCKDCWSSPALFQAEAPCRLE